MIKKISLKFCLVLFTLFLGINIAAAASYTIGVTSSGITKGSSTKLTIKGTDVTGRFNIKSSNPAVVSISEDRAWIENSSYTITLNALSVGTATITVTPSGVSDGSGNPVNLAAKSVVITVSLPREKSNDNNLKSLSVEGYEISPVFDKDTLDYSVVVPEGTTGVKINALANDRYASVRGNGDVTLTEGVNNFEIVVKSETGKEKVYKLTVNVIDQNPIEVTIDGNNFTVIKLRSNYSCPELFVESEVNIDGTPVPACYNEKLNYNLVGLKKEDGTVVHYIYQDGKYEKYNEVVGVSLRIVILDYKEDLDNLIVAEEMIEGVKYRVFKNNDQSKLYIVYGMNVATGEKDFYVYDSVNKTFSMYDGENTNILEELNQTYLYVIIIFGGALFLAIICIIALSSSRRKLKNRLLGKDNNKKEKKRKKKAPKNDGFFEENSDDNYNDLIEVIQSDEDEIVEEKGKKKKSQK